MTPLGFDAFGNSWKALGEVAEWLKAAVSKTVMGHWPIESSNLSLSATLFERRPSS
jgi:hypothetical protein